MAKPGIHPFDEVANEIVSWLEDEPEYYIEALRGGHQTPFAADVSEQQKLDYYRRQVFMQAPDGSVDFNKPNGEGRDMLIKRVGVKGYTEIMSQIMPKAGMRSIPEPEDDEPDDEEGDY